MNEFNEKTIAEKLNAIIDPDLKISLGEIGSIKSIEIQQNIIIAKIALVQPIHLVAEKINQLAIEALSEIAPEMELDVEISEIEGDYFDRDILGGVKNIIAVASGKGGVGKSSISSNLAAALKETGANVGILDGDVYGPSQPIMFGMQDERLIAEAGPDGKPIAYPSEKYGIKVASMGFIMNPDQAAIVRGPMLASYFSMLFEQLEWGNLDYLVFDLPPGTGDIQLTLTQKIPLTGAVIVTTPQEIAIADVRRSIAMFNRVNVDIIGIVENMSYFAPPDLPHKKYFIFGEGGGRAIANESGVELLGEVPLNIAMREGNDGGKPIVLDENQNNQAQLLKDIAEKVISKIRILNYRKLSSQKLEISL